MSLESVNECKNVHHVFVFIDRAVTLSGRSFPFPAMHLSFHLTRDRKALRGKFVFCDIELYELNEPDVKSRQLSVKVFLFSRWSASSETK